MKLSSRNRQRLRQTARDGGLHRVRGLGFYDTYGRMSWDSPAPTITTRCVSLSNGRFGHPRFNRAITVREAARLQGFPDSFLFDERVTVGARQVGNAVPPPVARWIARSIRRSW